METAKTKGGRTLYRATDGDEIVIGNMVICVDRDGSAHVQPAHADSGLLDSFSDLRIKPTGGRGIVVEAIGRGEG